MPVAVLHGVSVSVLGYAALCVSLCHAVCRRGVLQVRIEVEAQERMRLEAAMRDAANEKAAADARAELQRAQELAGTWRACIGPGAQELEGTS